MGFGVAGALVLIAGAVLYLWLSRPLDGANAPPPHAQPRGVAVDATTELDEGDLVEALSDGLWCDAIVLSATDGGTVRVHYVGWPPSYDEEVPRHRLRFVSEPPGEDGPAGH